MKKNYQTKLNRIGVILREIVWYLERNNAFKISNIYSIVYNEINIQVRKNLVEHSYYFELREHNGKLWNFFLISDETIIELKLNKSGILQLKDLYEKLKKR